MPDNNAAAARSARVREAAAELYAGEPAGFIRRRGELAAAARASGDAAAAREIAGLRKPTRSAWAVNRLVRADPGVPARLAGLGTALREAGSSLDGQALRELSRQRRELIAELTRRALAGQGDPPVGLQEEVSGTLGAAVSDPDVAADLGTLARPVERSGFGLPGLGAPGPPRPAAARAAPAGQARRGRERGDRERAREKAERAEREQAERAERAEQERRRRAAAVREAERAVQEAERAAAAARDAERARAEAAERLERDLAAAQDGLAAARRASRAAAGALRGARRALDRLRSSD